MFIKNIIKRTKSKKQNSILIKRFVDYADLFFNSGITTLYPKLLTDIKWNRILVLTPHADDETFGAGGFICAAVAKNKKVKVVLYSDNSESIIGSNVVKTIELRLAEFGKAMLTLGVTEKEKLKISPISFLVSNELIEKTRNIITDFSPDLILLPSFIENHEEHKILNKVLANSLSSNLQTDVMKIDIMLFEVWTPFAPNVVIKISSEMNKKIEAIRCYQSQLDNIDYEKSIEGLNRYRSIYHFQGKEFCEAFMLLDSTRYVNLVNKFYGR